MQVFDLSSSQNIRVDTISSTMCCTGRETEEVDGEMDSEAGEMERQG